jgi:hypothetical protein
MANTRILPVTESAFTLDDCMIKSGSIPGMQEWFENQYHLVIGEIEDCDFMLINYLILHTAPPGGGYHLVENGVENYFSFFMLPKQARGKIMDNDYLAGGAAPWEAHERDALKVIREEDRVVWKLAGWEFIARPPYWALRGSNKDIELDLKMHTICPGFSYLGEFKDMAQNKSAGIDEYYQAEGTITVAGKKHEISHAGGLYEHVALPGWDDVEVVRPGGYTWMIGYSEEIQVFVFAMAGINNFTAHVIVDGKPVSFHGTEQVCVLELESWADPKSKMVTPCKWRVMLSSDEGVLDVVVSSGGRATKIKCHRNGYLGHYDNLATMNGAFTIADGRTIPVENVRMSVDRSFIFHVLQ